MTETNIIPLVEHQRPSTFHGGAEAIIHRMMARLEAAGLPDELAASRRLVARAEEEAEAARHGRMAAAQRLDAARARLLGSEVIDVDEYDQVVRETQGWLADTPTSAAPTMAGLMQIVSELQGRALATVTGEVSGIFGRLQGKAAEVVAEVAGAPKLPPRVWSANPQEAGTVAIQAGCELTWATLVRAAAKWRSIVEAATMCLDSGGLGVLIYRDGCPTATGLLYLDWVAVEDGGGRELRRLPEPLRLRYACDQGWRPGLWLPADHEAQAKPRRGPLAVAAGWVGR